MFSSFMLYQYFVIQISGNPIYIRIKMLIIQILINLNFNTILSEIQFVQDTLIFK